MFRSVDRVVEVPAVRIRGIEGIRVKIEPSSRVIAEAARSNRNEVVRRIIVLAGYWIGIPLDRDEIVQIARQVRGGDNLQTERDLCFRTGEATGRLRTPISAARESIAPIAEGDHHSCRKVNRRRLRNRGIRIGRRDRGIGRDGRIGRDGNHRRWRAESERPAVAAATEESFSAIARSNGDLARNRAQIQPVHYIAARLACGSGASISRDQLVTASKVSSDYHVFHVAAPTIESPIAGLHTREIELHFQRIRCANVDDVASGRVRLWRERLEHPTNVIVLGNPEIELPVRGSSPDPN